MFILNNFELCNACVSIVHHMLTNFTFLLKYDKPSVPFQNPLWITKPRIIKSAVFWPAIPLPTLLGRNQKFLFLFFFFFFCLFWAFWGRQALEGWRLAPVLGFGTSR